MRFIKLVLFSLFIGISYASSAGAQSTPIKVLVPGTQQDSLEKFIDSFVSIAAENGVEVQPIRNGQDMGGFLDPYFVVKERVQEVELALLPAEFLPEVHSNPALNYTSLVTFPWAVESLEQNFFVQDSIVGELIATELASQNLVMLGFWSRPPLSMIATNKWESVDDLAGMKIRSVDSGTVAMMRNLGATPIKMGFAEATQAMQAGAIDAAEFSAWQITGASLFSSGGTLVGNYAQSLGFIVADTDKWLTYTEKTRSVLKDAARRANGDLRENLTSELKALPEMANNASALYLTSGDESWGQFREVAYKTYLQFGNADVLNEKYRSDAWETLNEVLKAGTSSGDRGDFDGGINAGRPKIMFATNRNDELSNDLDNRFGVVKDESNEIRCGEIQYASNPARKFGSIHQGVISLSNDQLSEGMDECASYISGFMQGYDRINIFFHGYNNTFSFAVRRGIAFLEDFALQNPLIVWSWPSAGTKGLYVFDRNSVDFSEEHLREFVSALAKNGTIDDVTLIAHSMGSLMAANFVEFAIGENVDVDNLVFVAADFPKSNFNQFLAGAGTGAPRKTLYANEHDRALKVSRKVNGENPVGLGGKYLQELNGVETVDVSRVARGGLFDSNHSHGFDVPKVAADISELVISRNNADDRQLPTRTLNDWKFHFIQ